MDLFSLFNEMPTHDASTWKVEGNKGLQIILAAECGCKYLDQMLNQYGAAGTAIFLSLSLSLGFGFVVDVCCGLRIRNRNRKSGEISRNRPG